MLPNIAVLDPKTRFSIRNLTLFVSGLAIVLYYLGIIFLGLPRWQALATPDAAKYVSGAVTVIGATLATYFGGVVGLNRVNATIRGGNPAAQAPAAQAPAAQAGAAPAAAAPAAAAPAAAAPVPELSGLQIIAAWAYILSLVLALLIWISSGFAETTEEAVRNLALTLPGVAAGILAVTLNVERPPV
jgi:hypothetical protein